jgi:antitoxin component HigA of HigAB toxin-antitoxin module
MSTPVINAIDNVNQTSLETVFAAVAADPTARDNLSQSDRNIDKVSTNVDVIKELNASEDAILRLLCRREGRDPANFADLDAVAADQGLMQAIAGRQESSKILARSQKASAAAAVSQTAMQELAASQTAMQEVIASQTARDEVIASQTARDEVIASQTAMQEVAASQTAMQEVIASQTAMQEVAASQTAMQEVGASQTAMQEVAASQTAMTEIDQVDFAVRAIMCGTTSQDPTSFADADAVSQDAAAMSEIAGNATTMNTIAASQTAMQEVAASQAAMVEIGLSQTAQTEILNSGTAVTALNSESTSFSFSDSRDRTNSQRQEIPQTDENYAVYIKKADYTGFSGEGVSNAGWYDTNGSYLGGTINDVFVDTLTIGWDKSGNFTSKSKLLSGDIEAVIF